MKKIHLTCALFLIAIIIPSCVRTRNCECVEHWGLTHETGVFIVLEEPVSWISKNGHKITQTASFWAGEPTTEQLNIASKGGIFKDPNYYIIEGSFPKQYKKGSFQQVNIRLQLFFEGITGIIDDDGYNTYKVSCIESE